MTPLPDVSFTALLNPSDFGTQATKAIKLIREIGEAKEVRGLIQAELDGLDKKARRMKATMVKKVLQGSTEGQKLLASMSNARGKILPSIASTLAAR